MAIAVGLNCHTRGVAQPGAGYVKQNKRAISNGTTSEKVKVAAAVALSTVFSLLIARRR